MLTSGKRSTYYVGQPPGYDSSPRPEADWRGDLPGHRLYPTRRAPETPGPGFEWGSGRCGCGVGEAGWTWFSTAGRERNTERANASKESSKKATNWVLVDDLITAGSTLASTIQAVRAAGAETQAAFVVVDRLEGGRQSLESLGVTLTSLLTIKDLSEIGPRGLRSLPPHESWAAWDSGGVGGKREEKRIFHLTGATGGLYKGVS